MSLSSPVTSARLNAASNQAFLVSSVMSEGLSHSWNSWNCWKQVAFQPFLVGCQLFVPVSQQNLINVIHLELNVAKFNIYFTNCTFHTPLVSWILEGKVKSAILWNNPELVGEAVDNLRSSWETSVSLSVELNISPIFHTSCPPGARYIMLTSHAPTPGNHVAKLPKGATNCLRWRDSVSCWLILSVQEEPWGSLTLIGRRDAAGMHAAAACCRTGTNCSIIAWECYYYGQIITWSEGADCSKKMHKCWVCVCVCVYFCVREKQIKEKECTDRCVWHEAGGDTSSVWTIQRDFIQITV